MSAYEHLEHLVNACGDRRPGSRGGELAAEYIVSVLAGRGYVHEREAFDCFEGVHAPNALSMALGAAASLLMSRRGRPARCAGYLLAGLMALVMLGVETTLFNPARALLPKKKGTNILARGGGSPRVIVVAHYDTINQGEAFRPGRVRFIREGALVQGLLPVATLALGRRHAGWPGRLLRLALLAGALSMLHWQYMGDPNGGANDNGSGVAAALECAAQTGADQAARMGIWFLFTDGEEAGLAGMVEFCDRHRGELGDALVLNLESVGRGALTCLGKESLLIGRRPPAWLLEDVKRFAALRGVPLEVCNTATAATDSVAALARGIPAVTLAGLGANGLIEGWHFEDTLPMIDRETLESNALFAAALLAHLASRSPGVRAEKHQK